MQPGDKCRRIWIRCAWISSFLVIVLIVAACVIGYFNNHLPGPNSANCSVANTTEPFQFGCIGFFPGSTEMGPFYCMDDKLAARPIANGLGEPCDFMIPACIGCINGMKNYEFAQQCFTRNIKGCEFVKYWESKVNLNLPADLQCVVNDQLTCDPATYKDARSLSPYYVAAIICIVVALVCSFICCVCGCGSTQDQLAEDEKNADCNCNCLFWIVSCPDPIFVCCKSYFSCQWQQEDDGPPQPENMELISHIPNAFPPVPPLDAFPPIPPPLLSVPPPYDAAIPEK